MTTTGNFERFYYFKKTETSFEKLEYRFSVETTAMENATLSLKIALSKVIVKTNREGSTKQTYQKERGFATNYFIF